MSKRVQFLKLKTKNGSQLNITNYSGDSISKQCFQIIKKEFLDNTTLPMPVFTIEIHITKFTTLKYSTTMVVLVNEAILCINHIVSCNDLIMIIANNLKEGFGALLDLQNTPRESAAQSKKSKTMATAMAVDEDGDRIGQPLNTDEYGDFKTKDDEEGLEQESKNNDPLPRNFNADDLLKAADEEIRKKK